jgi:PPM family protein phosphatase
MSQGFWEYGLSTHVGTIKTINEDQSMIKTGQLDEFPYLLGAVSDGMGGMDAGDLASQTAIYYLQEWINYRIDLLLRVESPDVKILEELEEVFFHINAQLLNIKKKEGKDLGTTLSLLFLYKGLALVMHVGDSRIYRLEKKKDQLHTLTEDHSWVGAQVRNGLLSEEQARTHPKRNVLLQCLGIKEFLQPFSNRVKFQGEDLFLLCSDGFYSLFSHDEIRDSIIQARRNFPSLQQASDFLVNEALKNGAKDNVSVLIVQPVSHKKGWLNKLFQKNE